MPCHDLILREKIKYNKWHMGGGLLQVLAGSYELFWWWLLQWKQCCYELLWRGYVCVLINEIYGLHILFFFFLYMCKKDHTIQGANPKFAICCSNNTTQQKYWWGNTRLYIVAQAKCFVNDGWYSPLLSATAWIHKRTNKRNSTIFVTFAW